MRESDDDGVDEMETMEREGGREDTCLASDGGFFDGSQSFLGRLELPPEVISLA